MDDTPLYEVLEFVRSVPRRLGASRLEGLLMPFGWKMDIEGEGSAFGMSTFLDVVLGVNCSAPNAGGCSATKYPKAMASEAAALEDCAGCVNCVAGAGGTNVGLVVLDLA